MPPHNWRLGIILLIALTGLTRFGRALAAPTVPAGRRMPGLEPPGRCAYPYMTDSVVVGTAFKLIARPARFQRDRLPWAGFELAALSCG